MKRNENYNWECGALFAGGIVVVAVGSDLVGRLLHFLHGEWQFLSIGLVVLIFIGAVTWIESGYFNAQALFEKSIDAKLAVLETKIADVRLDRAAIRDEISTIRRGVDLQWDLCEKTLKEVDELMAQKTPVHIEAPQPVQTIEPDVQDAIEEIVGGAR